MAAVAAGLIGPAIDVVKWVGRPILRQLQYLCCFTANIANLGSEAKKLDNVTRDLQVRVDRERDNQQVIFSTVESWLADSTKINGQKDTILVQVPNVRSGCLKIRARFSLSKKAKKTTDRMKELQGQSSFDIISERGLPAAAMVVPLGITLEFESRKRLEDDIMTTLKFGEKKMIGICGMGGLGKTTMAKRIMIRVLEEQIFEEAVMAVVSQQVDKPKIQVKIGSSLGLDLKDQSSQAIVQKLHARLSGTKKILLVLDDVWDGPELEELGVPCDSRRLPSKCTVLITSRNKDALDYLNVQKVFGMKVLKEEEAWDLFTERAGTCLDDSRLNSIAKEVVKECNGLPIALTTLGASLRDKSVSTWEYALVRLRQPEPDDTPNYIAKVYNPLKLSYDSLEQERAKSIFLLCSLFREDTHIPIEWLAGLCMGLGIFQCIRNLQEARKTTRAFTEVLKSRSLLLDGFNEEHVRMHDVVRDACIFIAKEEGHIGGNDCTWMSYLQLPPTRLEFPKLRVLYLVRPYSSEFEAEFELDNAFFEGSRGLNVLYIENYQLTSLSLTNLHTLVFFSCQKLKTISFVGNLVNLEILICRECSSLEELPVEMKRLKHLKLLELSECDELQTIGGGIISSLVGLEDMKIRDSFKKWEADDSDLKQNARLRELEALTNLTCLDIEIEDPALATENVHISSKLQRFKIAFSHESYEYSIHPSHKKLCLRGLKGETLCLGDWIVKQLLRDTECLYLGECEAMKNIVRSSVVENATVFPSLEYLKLDSLPQLEQISDAPISSTSFQNLSSIQIKGCPLLRNLWQLSIAGNDCLPQLQLLDIEECEKMEQVFLWNENTNPQTITKIFPKLKEVQLGDLPNLESFFQGIEGIEFPLLTTFMIEKCPKMTNIVSSGFSTGVGRHQSNLGGSNNADIHHFFCQSEKVSFGNLKKLGVNRNPFCTHQIPVSFFSRLEFLCFSMSLTSSIAKNLVNLKSLRISDSNEMVQLIEDEEMASGGQRTTATLFPKLLTLELYNLPKMVSFCGWKCVVELPSLSHVDIQRCHEMKNFSLGFLAAPNLESFTTDFNHDLEVGVNVSFDRLKKLVIIKAGHPFHHHKLFLSLVNGVEVLSLRQNGGMSLFPASIAGATFNCRVLRISECDEMEKVIEDEEKVVSGAQRPLLFPYLEELRLDNLPSLKSFCEWTCDIELPSLKRVEIYNCPNLKHFSMGPLTTPNLKIVPIDYTGIRAEKNLNGALPQHYLARAKEKEERRRRQAGTGEIEEEQNI